VKLAVYGTLRGQGRLHDDYLRGATFRGAVKLNGYDMWSLGSYPYVTKGKGTILAEIWEAKEWQATNTARMEMGAGYRLKIVETIHGPALLFYMPLAKHTEWQENRYDDNKIPDGDWMQYYTGKEDKDYIYVEN
jgi:gamma-glutamylcyclotransferase (GGCT)/AIG2-like uncharacterized protein YtfP